MKRRDQEARDAEIVRLAKLFVPTARIARVVRCSPEIVRRVKKAHGIDQTAHMPPLTTAQLARAETLLADGCSRNEVARTLGCSKDQLRRAFPEARWSIEERRQAEHDTGQRAKNSPQLHRTRPKGWCAPSVVDGPPDAQR